MSRQHSIVRHKANYFFQMLEDDYILMYQALAEELDPIKISKEEKVSAPADCKAMIASVLEHWMNSKRPTAKCEEDLYVYFTYPEWETALRYRYKRSTIIQCLKEMETEGSYTNEDGNTHTGTIKKRHFVQNTFQYVLNLPVIQALLEKLPEVSPFDTYEKPMLGRPHKNRGKINDIKINGLILDDRSVKIDDRSVKTNAPFYTQITQTYTDLEDTHVGVSDETTNAHIPENETHYQHSDGSSPQDIHNDQASTDIPIATTTPQTELIGVATRNTDSLVEVTQAAAPNKRRGARKPKVTKPEDENMEKRIDAVLNCLDELGTEYAGEEFHYSRFKTDREAVKTLLTSWQNLSREQVQATYRFMMDTPKSDDGWLWSDHMSVKAFCNNFATQYAKMRKKGTSNGHAPPMSALDQAIRATRDLAKEGAEMEARYSRKRAQ